MHASSLLAGSIRMTAVVIIAAIALTSVRLHDFITFHAAVEGVTVAVSLFVLIFILRLPRSRRLGFFTIIAASSVAVVIFDTMHILSCKGMGFSFAGANNATTFWILGRIMEIGGYVTALGFASRTIAATPLILLTLAVGIIGSWLTLAGALPAMFIEGTGLTLTKIWIEYILVGATLACLVLSFRIQPLFNAVVHISFILAIAFTGLSEFIFTMYATISDGFNTVGHIFKFISYALLFNAIRAHGSPPRPYGDSASSNGHE